MVRVQVDHDSCHRNHRLHYGSGLPVFRGDLRQEGYGLGGILGGLFRQAIPILKPVMKTIGKAALRTGGRVLSDVVRGKKPIKDAMKDRFLETVDEAIGDNVDDDDDDDASRSRVRRRKRRRRQPPAKRKRVDILD